MAKGSWFSFRNSAADPSVAEVLLYGTIGSWDEEFLGLQTARSLVESLEGLADSVRTINVRVNSPGGCCFAGVAVANALRQQRTDKGRQVVAHVDGLAASAASIIVMGAERIVIADNALLFIHEPWAFGVGDAVAHEKLAADLRVARGSIVATYRWHSTLSEDELGAAIAAGTWYDADAAIAAGLATEKTAVPTQEDDEQAYRQAAAFSTAAMARLSVPERFRPRVAALATPPASRRPAAAVDVIKACAAAGCLSLAESLVEASATTAEVKARVTEAKAANEAEAKRAEYITAVCAQADAHRFAAGYIKDNVSLATVKAHMVELSAMVDRFEIDSTLMPDDGGGTRTANRMPNPTAVYAARAAQRRAAQ